MLIIAESRWWICRCFNFSVCLKFLIIKILRKRKDCCGHYFSRNLSCPSPLFSSKAVMLFLLLCKYPRCSIQAFITLYFNFLFSHLSPPLNLKSLKDTGGTSSVAQWLTLRAPNAGGLGSIPGQGTRSYMLQLKIRHATTETWCTQRNAYFKKERTQLSLVFSSSNVSSCF